jgi:DNA polymerase-1
MNNTMQQLQQKDAYKLLHYGSIAFARAEQQGIRVDTSYLNQKQKELTDDIEKVENKLKNTKFWREWREARNGQEPNYNSNPQLKYFLYQVKGYEPFKTTATGAGSTDEESLKQLGIKELDYILRIRKLKKIRDTYLNGLLVETVRGYIHPFQNLHTVRTFRSSSSLFNFHNLPKRDDEAMRAVRSAIYPRPGHRFLEVDFGALEVAISACIHQDPTMLSYLREGGDMHKDVAEQIFMMNIDKSTEYGNYLRKATKNSFTFPQFYGDYYKNNASSICKWTGLPYKKFRKGKGTKLEDKYLSDHFIENGIKSYDDLVEHMRNIEDDFWNNRFPVYQKWKDEIWEFYKENGYITSPTGFVFKGVMRKNDVNNYPVQASAFHCLLWSFIQSDWKIKNEGWRSKLVNQVHDSMLIDNHPDEFDDMIDVVKQITTVDLSNNWGWIITPLTVGFEAGEVDESWADIKEIDV